MNAESGCGPKPDWLKVRAFGGDEFARVSSLLKSYRLNTVCRAANCPNRGECFSRGTATFLILGPFCTRNCRFCDVKSGVPLPPDPTEPERVAAVVRELELKYAVVTSVTRDDLPDGGAGQFADVIREIRKQAPGCKVEVLTPDFREAPQGLGIVMEAKPDVFNHNLETVPRLYAQVRPGADYGRSLKLLKLAAEQYGALTKSGLMVGLGETIDEVGVVFSDLAGSKVRILTIGQYLSPSRDHYPVHRYVPPAEFDLMAAAAKKAGIDRVFAGPLVRSSYMAEQVFIDV